MTDLMDLDNRFAAAELAVTAARRAVDLDKAGRKGSIIGRIVDFVTDTKAEKDLEIAEKNLDEITSAAHDAVKLYLDRTIARYVAAEGTDEAIWKTQKQRVEIAVRSHAAASRISKLAADARTALEAAASACSSASTYEMMDAVSSNKGISAMSTMQTSSAKTKVAEAKEAVAELRGAASEASHLRAEINMPDDMMDLAFDFALDLPLDILSILNIGKLSGAAGKCREAAEQIERMQPSMENKVTATSDALDTEQAELAEIEKPYLAQARENVPHGLRFAVPQVTPTHNLPRP